ncbi:pentatricopeptide repeat-containing protein At2g21090-like [Phalaenopsis equestris]|uniref:pentatricopeptide repeat-containing protein At2g21090-like n=1 Tax=Phalaenopsis equestris TaxID=78828 RepID=UPI0009E351E3|nr:pentatricopeptide repeat-containing protein At2g21090-like [Phalaenopsis equestris]XP_020581245.1 pentatricopeptide repeat-containing protein At2g21090-like [Phalaenopsis equestris]XP_020581247.1 pentatricopeptide repeat-containing protein At2g21090-like [Phalaenopsis equestris]XP_020581248.1 pentatricopeptide repeat-containing protein At2g21090-like [Phalaenopsis equestris]
MPHRGIQRAKPSPCLLASLKLHISAGRLADAVAVLPFLARCGLRPPIRTLSFLLTQCLYPHPSLSLARRVLHFLHFTALKPVYPSNTFLSNHILHLHFLLGRSDRAQHLFGKMPQPNVFSCNTMLAGYVRLGLLAPALSLFDGMPHKDLVSWNTIILALARSNMAAEAVTFYKRLRNSTLGFNAHSFSALLTTCSSFGYEGLTFQAHGQVLVSGCSSNLVVSSLIVDAYAKHGMIEESRRAFDEIPVRDVLAWTSMVSAYTKSGDMRSARMLFDEMPDRNLVSWTVLIGGYIRNGLASEALNLFRLMVADGVQPDQFIFSSCICAASAISSAKHGKQIHARLFRTHFNPNVIVLSSLIDMYSKCGDLEGGRRLFYHSNMDSRDVVMWNTIMSAVGHHGLGKEAINLFEEMIRNKIKPDANTFVVLLTACSHSGLVIEGLQFFESMVEKCGILPEENLLVCLVDLLGRAGKFQEAMEWLVKEPCKSSSRAWNVLLGACKIHGNLELGEQIARRLLDLESQPSGSYVLLSNIFAEDGNWVSVENVRQSMEEKGMRKECATSWIEVDNDILRC